MAYRELTVTIVREVLRRWQNGQKLRSIAKSCGVDRKTVGRYVEAAKRHGLPVGGGAETLTDEVVGAIARGVQVGAPVRHGSGHAVCQKHVADLLMWHKQGAAGPKLLKLLRRSSGQAVSLRTLQRFMRAELAKTCAPDSTHPVASCAPGAELQVDCEVVGLVPYGATGNQRMLHAFVCTAVHSRHMFVFPCWQETTETTIEALEAAWQFFGGVFRGMVCDNLKAVVAKPDPVASVYSEIFLESSQARDFLIGPARVRAPKDKGRVENGVKYTQGSLFAAERFDTIEQWRQEAERWCREDAGMRTHGTTGWQPLPYFEACERQALGDKPSEPWDMPRWTTAKVGRDNRIRVENSWYRVQAGLCGQEVRVRVDRATVRVHLNWEPLHAFARVPAFQTGGLVPTTGDGLAHGIAGRDSKGLLAAATKHGESVRQVTVRLLGRGLWFDQVRQVLRLLRLCEQYGAAAVDAACAKVLAVDDDDPVRIERVVTLGLESRESTPVPTMPATAVTPKYARPNETWRQQSKQSQGEQHVT